MTTTAPDLLEDELADDGLFPIADAWDGDPLRPDLDAPTPIELVASLSDRDRGIRLDALEEQARAIYDDGLATWLPERPVRAVAVLFSGGNDSTTLAHWTVRNGLASHAVHAHTGIGIEQTRQFVRDTCAAWGLPLIEKRTPAGETYRDMVLGQIKARKKEGTPYPGGFPGPTGHFMMYQRLKERALDAAKHDLGIVGSTTERAVYVAGRRRQESRRRSGGSGTPPVPMHERKRNVVWVSPFVFWTKLDLNAYRARYDVPRNEVADLIHMSGECLCGAYAAPGELEMIREWFPEVVAEIHALEDEARAAGIPEPFCRWGHGKKTMFRGFKGQEGSGPLCQACDLRREQLNLGV